MFFISNLECAWCARTAKLDNGIRGISFAKARAWATEQPTLSPVNDPGPLLTAIKSNSFFSKLNLLSRSSMKSKILTHAHFLFQ